VLGDPVSGVDPMGLMWGDHLGEEALNYWVNKQITTGNSLYYVPAFFVALWTPDTSDSTAETLSLCVPALRPFKNSWRFDPWGKWKNNKKWQKGPHLHFDPFKNSDELMRWHLPFQHKQWWNNAKNIYKRRRK